MCQLSQRKNHFEIDVLAVFRSNFLSNPIENKQNLVSCLGKVVGLEPEANGFKIGDRVTFLGFDAKSRFHLTSNLISLPVEELGQIASVPLGCYAMKILRYLKPKIGENVLLIGANPLILILAQLLDLAGVFVCILDKDELYFGNANEKLKTKINIISKLEDIKDCLIEEIIDYVIIFDEQPELEIVIKKISPLMLTDNVFTTIRNLNKNFVSKSGIFLKTSYIDIFDIGFDQVDYNEGINYPFPYIRWEFKRNLDLLIELMKEKKIVTDFLNPSIIKISSFDEISRYSFPAGNTIQLFILKSE